MADIFQYALMAELGCVRRGELVDLFQRKILVPHWQTATTLHNVRFCVLALLGFGDALSGVVWQHVFHDVANKVDLRSWRLLK